MKRMIILFVLISTICLPAIVYGSYKQEISKENQFTIAPIDEVTIDWAEIISIQWSDYPYETEEATD